MTMVFLKVGQDVHFVGGDLTEAINEGVAPGYVEGYLRKSVVAEPLFNRKTLKTTHLQSSTLISFLAIK